MIGRGLDGSALGVYQLLSANDFDGGGSSNPVDLSNYATAMLVLAAGSVNTGFQARMERSATSNGTFGEFGASLAVNAGCVIFTRGFGLGTSNVWHRLYYTNGTGSATAAVVLVAQGARVAPITQPTGVTTWSFVPAAK